MAYCYINFVRNHIKIVPAPIKYIFEKSSDEVPKVTTMKKLHRFNHTVISGSPPYSYITAIMKTVTLSHLFSDSSFR